MIKIHYHIVWFDEKNNSSNPHRKYKQVLSIADNSTYNDFIDCIISESNNQFNDIPTQIEENRNSMIITIGTKPKTDDDLTKQKLLNNQIVNINDIVNVPLDKFIYFICGIQNPKSVTQKRKAKKCVDDTNTIEPNRKRRKITNHNDANNKLDELIKSYKSLKKNNEELNHKLIKQREHYNKQIKMLKQGVGGYKSE
eukprot:39868_1